MSDTALLPFSAAREKWGFINKMGSIEIQAIYRFAGRFSEGIAVVRNFDKSRSAIDVKGAVVFGFDGENVGWFTQGRLSVEKDGKAGFVDRTGKVVIPFSFYTAHDFCGDRSVVCVHQKWGAIDLNGNWIIEPKFEWVLSWSEDGNFTAVKEQDGKWILIDKQVKQVHPEKFLRAFAQTSGYVIVQFSDGRYGLLDEQLQELWRKELSDIDSRVAEQTIAASVDDKWGLLDLDGQWLLEPTYTDLSHIHENRRAVYVGGTRNLDYQLINGAFGYLNEYHEIVIEPIYETVLNFENGIAKVNFPSSNLNHKEFQNEWGYIDSNGKCIWRT